MQYSYFHKFPRLQSLSQQPGGAIDFGQCCNYRLGFGLLAVTQKLRTYYIIRVFNIVK